MESGANTKEVLTPKNVYRFLTDNLPGLYPHGVIPVAERKGLTLVKFWAQVLDGIIPPEWHASLFGGTQRSRRLSDMMNRTGVQPLPPKLQQEMNALLSGETLIRLSQQVQDFLRSAHYDADALTRALPDFVRMMMENEECMKPEHEQVFENLQKSRETLPRTFVDMLTLSWLVRAGNGQPRAAGLLSCAGALGAGAVSAFVARHVRAVRAAVDDGAQLRIVPAGATKG